MLKGDEYLGPRPRHTPVGHNLKDSIEITGRNLKARNPNIRIGMDPRDYTTFPYSNVTRSGRRAFGPKVVRRAGAERRSSARALTDAGVPTGAFLGRPAMLRFPDASGKIIYRRGVGRWRPASDWVSNSEPEVRREADIVFRGVSNRVDKILTGRGRVARVRAL